jgi:hypothetical protein
MLNYAHPSEMKDFMFSSRETKVIDTYYACASMEHFENRTQDFVKAALQDIKGDEDEKKGKLSCL